MSSPKHQRSRFAMAHALARHTRLLDSYVTKAETDIDYLGEIAGKLRLLLAGGRNTPLLLAVAEAYGARLSITPIEGPMAGRVPMTWPEILDQLFANVPGEKPFTIEKLIRAWAEQSGSAHEDWKLDEEFVRVLSLPDFISVGGTGGGRPLLQHNMITMGRNVVESAKALLKHIERIEQDERAAKKGGA